MKRTSRGFKIYGEFKDSRAQKIRVQESSAMGSPRIWMFVHNEEGKETIMHLGEPQAVTAYMSKADARKLVKALERFIKQL